LRKNKSYKKLGEPPGTLTHTIEKKMEETIIKKIDYRKENFHIEEVQKIDKDISSVPKSSIRWIKISGLKDLDKIESLGSVVEIHPLVLEDIISPNQRTKYEDYENYIFIVLKMITWDESLHEFDFDQISIILGANYIISIEEKHTDLFDPILERIKIPKGRLRSMGADYLAYALLDIIIDHYFINQDLIGEVIEEIEEKLVREPEVETLQSIHKLKRNVIELRKSIWPMRDVINSFQKEDSGLVNDDLQIFLRDLYDHIYRINDSFQNYRDIITGMLDLYLSSVSNKINDIMKVLTIISTIFIPLSFIAGFYGMNFIYMPELSSPLSYPILIIIMISIAFLMLLFFRKKSWI